MVRWIGFKNQPVEKWEQMRVRVEYLLKKLEWIMDKRDWVDKTIDNTPIKKKKKTIDNNLKIKM